MSSGFIQGHNQEIILTKQSHWVGIICPFPVEIGLNILKIHVRQMLGCLTIDYAPVIYQDNVKTNKTNIFAVCDRRHGTGKASSLNSSHFQIDILRQSSALQASSACTTTVPLRCPIAHSSLSARPAGLLPPCAA